jgi:hypothetical protein
MALACCDFSQQNSACTFVDGPLSLAYQFCFGVLCRIRLSAFLQAIQ